VAHRSCKDTIHGKIPCTVHPSGRPVFCFQSGLVLLMILGFSTSISFVFAVASFSPSTFSQCFSHCQSGLGTGRNLQYFFNNSSTLYSSRYSFDSSEMWTTISVPWSFLSLSSIVYSGLRHIPSGQPWSLRLFYRSWKRSRPCRKPWSWE